MTRLFDSSYATADAYVAAARSSAAVAKVRIDYAAVADCDALVVAVPCGSDAHAEAMFALRDEKFVFVLLPEPPLPPPDLMYALDGIVIVAAIPELIARLRRHPAISKIYVASSWTRTAAHPVVIAALRAAGFEVFDYRNAEPCKQEVRTMTTEDDFFRNYEQHLSEPAVRLERHLKLARQLQLHPLELIDKTDPEGMKAAVSEYLRALDAPRLRPAPAGEQTDGRTAEEINLIDLMADTVTEHCPDEAPWLTADPDFIREVLELHWGALASGSVIEDAIAVITHEASK